MTLFWIIAGLMIAAALAFVLPPLLGRRGRADVGREAVNVAIYRQRLAELEEELAAGAADPEEAAERRAELERNLLRDLEAGGGGASGPTRRRWWSGVGVAVVLSVVAVGLYLQLGAAPLLQLKQRQAEGDEQLRVFEAAVERLAGRLDGGGGDTEDWVMLARGYLVLGRYTDAARAYAQAHRLAADSPDVLVGYAQALALAAGENLQGRPTELLGRALELDPEHEKGLWLAGTAAFQRADYRQALAHWRRLRRLGPKDPELARRLQRAIAEAEAHLKGSG